MKREYDNDIFIFVRNVSKIAPSFLISKRRLKCQFFRKFLEARILLLTYFLKYIYIFYDIWFTLSQRMVYELSNIFELSL